MTGLRALLQVERMIAPVIANAVFNAAHGHPGLSRQRLARAIVHTKLLLHSLEVAQLENDRLEREEEAA